MRDEIAWFCTIEKIFFVSCGGFLNEDGIPFISTASHWSGHTSHFTKHVKPSKPMNGGPVFCGTGEFMIDKGLFVMTGETTHKIAESPS